MEAHSGSSSFILPGDPGWTGAEGSISTNDNTTYVWSFWYKGVLQFDLMIGDNLKYDLTGDPDGIVPAGAVAASSMIHWDLESADWTQFTYSYYTSTWLADSGVTEPVDLIFDIIGTEANDTDTGYVDDLYVGIVDSYDKDFGTPFNVEPDTLSTTTTIVTHITIWTPTIHLKLESVFASKRTSIATLRSLVSMMRASTSLNRLSMSQRSSLKLARVSSRSPAISSLRFCCPPCSVSKIRP